MSDKREKLKFNEFKNLVRGGAIWVIMNIENDYPPADGLWFHLKKLRREDCKTKQSVDKVWAAIKHIYLTGHIEDLYAVVSGKYDFQYLWEHKFIDTESRLTF